MRRSQFKALLCGALSIALVGTLASPAHADTRAAAKRHFKRGMALIEGGQVDEGIEELLVAYEIKPHPNVLYNVARAYLDKSDWVKAREYFVRYQESGAGDPAEIEGILASLDRRIEVTRRAASEAAAPAAAPAAEALADAPPEQLGPVAVATARPGEERAPADGLLPTTDPNQLTVADIQRAQQKLAVLLAQVERRPVGEATTMPAVAAAPAAELETAGFDLGERETRMYEEVVVTSSRREQSPLDAPNAITVITEEQIRAAGATSIPDLLRRVPGLDVVQMSASDWNLAVRGFNQRLSNKLLVLVDGRTVFADFVGSVFWEELPISMEDILRIEIVRGPGSALWGANAFGVVNIITKPPKDQTTNELSLAAGNARHVRGYASVAGHRDDLHWSASAHVKSFDKFNLEFSPDRIGADVNYNATRSQDLSAQGFGVNANASYEPTRDTTLKVSGGVSDGYHEFFAIGVLRNFYIEPTSSYGKLEFVHKALRIKTFINDYRADSGPMYSPVADLESPTVLTMQVFDFEPQVNADVELGGTHSFVLGGAYRLKHVDWTYLRGDGVETEHHFAAFAQDEWRLTDSLRLLGGYRLDRHPLVGPTHSPRGSIIYKLTEDQAVRFTYTTAFRTPTFLESYTDFRYLNPNARGVSLETVGNTELDPERITSFEVGYKGVFADVAEAFVDGFVNFVDNEIDLAPTEQTDPEIDPRTGSIRLVQSVFRNRPGQARAVGFEIGGRWFPTEWFETYANYSFQQIEDTDLGEKLTRNPQHKVNVGTQLRLDFGLDVSADLHFVDAVVWDERAFCTAADNPRGFGCTAAGDVYRGSDPVDSYFMLNARAGYWLVRDRLEVFAQGVNLLAIASQSTALAYDPTGGEVTERRFTGHREHPLGNFIPARVLAGASWRF